MKDEALSIFLDFDSLTTRGKLTSSLFETEVMLLAITVNSQYSNMKSRLLSELKFESQLARSKNTNIA